MAKSKAFIGIKRDTLLIVAAIPHARVTTFKSIGTYLSVVPRHVAYILATLAEDEQLAIPWYRVVGDGGKLGKARYDSFGRSQADLLAAEGVQVVNGVVAALSVVFIDVAQLDSKVLPHKIYASE